MNEFDLLLESELRRLLAPVVAAPAPRRGGAVPVRLRPGRAGVAAPIRATDRIHSSVVENASFKRSTRPSTRIFSTASVRAKVRTTVRRPGGAGCQTVEPYNAGISIRGFPDGRDDVGVSGFSTRASAGDRVSARKRSGLRTALPNIIWKDPGHAYSHAR